MRGEEEEKFREKEGSKRGGVGESRTLVQGIDGGSKRRRRKHARRLTRGGEGGRIEGRLYRSLEVDSGRDDACLKRLHRYHRLDASCGSKRVSRSSLLSSSAPRFGEWGRSGKSERGAGAGAGAGAGTTLVEETLSFLAPSSPKTACSNRHASK